jgi:tetratricopeptide (TPR) repeat protein
VRIVVAAALAALSILAGGQTGVRPGSNRGQTPGSPAARAAEAAYRANNMGVARLEQFAYDEATRSFREALRLSPGLAIARLNLAIAHFYGGRPVEAATEARAAAERLPSTPGAHYMVGVIAKAENRLDEAAAAFARVLQLDPQDAGSLVSLGQIHAQQRRFVEALALFDRALAAEPYNVTAAYNAALALTRAGRAEDGRAAMQRFEQLRDSPYGVTYAQIYLTQGKYGEAVASTGAEPELVNPATPAVTFGDATSTWLQAAGRAQPALSTVARSAKADTGGGHVLFDMNGDGSLDLVSADGSGLRLLRNAGGRFSDDTSAAGLASVREAAVAIAGDYDNDGRPDLFAIAAGAARLFRQKTDGAFDEVTSTAAIPAAPRSAAAAAFADLDHDGDLDVIVAGESTQLLRNNGNGTFADITAVSGFRAPSGRAIAVAPTDYDNRRDVDVLIAATEGAPQLFRNMRDGTFKDAAADAGLPGAGEHSALAVADVNKDGYPDIFIGRRNAPGLLSLSDGQGHFRGNPGPDTSRGAIAAQFVDYDNDGVLDLLTMARDGVALARQIGGGRWTGVSGAAGLAGVVPGGTSVFQSMALGDLDGDGDTDVSLRTDDGRVRFLRNDGSRNGGSRNGSLRVRLAPRVSNRSSAGAKIELRAGSLRQVLETSSSSPAVSPSGIVFGLGSRAAADVVRVLWPSGILQAETSPRPAAASRTFTVTELDRKPSSCPYLFTWNGTRFEFVTDFMGGGEMGGWAGPGQWNQPDPDEYVRIRGDQLRARNGRYELRVTNELEEALFVDRLQLVAVDHRAGVDVFPEEGLRQERRPFALQRVRRQRAPVRARDEHGHDVLAQIAALDRRYPDDFSRLPIRGYAAPHWIELDLGAAAGADVLLMTGWTDYAFSSDNVAASQSGAAMTAPSLQVKDASGAWRTVIEDLGFPVGRPQTIAVDLSGRFLSASREVRIVTTMRIAWDQIVVASAARESTRLTKLEPIAADLRWRGFSAETSPDGREPFGYDYHRVSAVDPWKVPAGRYTREGDVRPLLGTVDDMFVISRPGDQISLSFDARALPPLAAGWTRTFLLYVHGYSKEMNPRSAVPETVAPLPFRAMTKYPYGPDERYPWTPALREYDARYNTRVVTRTVPTIDTGLR